jgi:hypothetical protein
VPLAACHVEAGRRRYEWQALAEVVAERLGWDDDDGRRQFLDVVWKAATDFVNAPHHREGSGQGVWLDHCDARLTLIMTAMLSEYVGALRPS